MKNINFKFLGILLLVVLTLGSCKKWIDPNVNVNPDAPPDVDMSVILAYAEVNMAYNTVGGNDLARVTSMWMQYVSGMARQSKIQQNYLYTNSDINNLWNSNYATTMNDLNQIILKADVKLKSTPAEQSVGHVYKGIAEVLMANALGVTTDVWGDIPYSESFLGFDNLQPKFDTQEEIYTTIQSLLTDAIVHLRATTSSADRDIIFGGDAAKWLSTAWALKARYALHLSKISATAYTEALAAIDSGAIASNADDCDFPFAGYPYANPFNNFESERGDVQMHSTIIDTLKFRQDPRLAVYADPNGDGDFIGADFEYSGSGAEISWPGAAIAYETSVVQFITNTEVLFIKAEAKLKSGYPMSEVKADLVAAVTASMDKWGVFDATYMAFYDAAIQAIPDAAVDAIYTEIMRQKWIAMYYQLEAFNDWRRTNNVIGLPPNPQGIRVEIPRRFPYSVDEQTYNSNTPVLPNAPYQIWERVWWDKAK
jgi:hypothetical protein